MMAFSLSVLDCSQVRKSTLNPNANEFKPRFNTQVSMSCCCQATQLKYHKLSLLLSLIFLMSRFIFSLISLNQPTPRRLHGLRASRAPQLWSSSPQLCTVRRSAFPRCIPSHQSALECRWDPHLHVVMCSMRSDCLYSAQHHTVSLWTFIKDPWWPSPWALQTCLLMFNLILVFSIWFISNACQHYFLCFSFFYF